MIEINEGRLIHLKLNNTSYIFKITDSGHLEHLYYGKKLERVKESEKAISEKNIVKNLNAINLNERHPNLDLNALSLEASFEGKGDFKAPLARIKGSRVLDFRYSAHREYPGIRRYKNSSLPLAVASQDDAETLEILLEDSRTKISIILCYTIFRKDDIITRKTIIRNDSKEEIEISSCYSMQLDLFGSDFKLITLTGAPLKEMEACEEIIKRGGSRRLSSRVMSTGFENSNAFALVDKNGMAYISALLYSSDFEIIAEQSPYNKLHIISGISSENFCWTLNPSEEFESPEAILCCSEKGLEDASRRFKDGIRSVVMRSSWNNRMRPVTLSTRNITGLEINEKKTLELAKAASSFGFEALVIDDGWFAVRSDKEMSLGDWYVNTSKFPEGLKKLSERVHRCSLLFGLYFDIETVSRKSNLFEKHPSWVIRDKESIDYSSSSDDFLLDFTNEEVQEWAADTISNIIDGAHLDYIRYEKSRMPSEIFTSFAGEFSLRYQMGVYRTLNTIMRKFPNLIIETGFKGGARFDLGMLSYSSLMRLSENTDVVSRTKSIEGSRLFFPEYATLTSIAASPDPLTFTSYDLETKFNASIFNAFEYSLDITKLDKADELKLKNQIEFYKLYREVLQFGTIRTCESGNKTIWSASNPDASIIIVLYLLKKAEINAMKERLYITEARDDYKYRIYTRSHVQSEEEEMEHPMEIECYDAWGDALKWAGIALSEKTGAGLYSDDMRRMGDGSSRLYILRKID